MTREYQGCRKIYTYIEITICNQFEYSYYKLDHNVRYDDINRFCVYVN